MSGGLSWCAHIAHINILEGYPVHTSWLGYFFYSKGHLSGVALKTRFHIHHSCDLKKRLLPDWQESVLRSQGFENPEYLPGKTVRPHV